MILDQIQKENDIKKIPHQELDLLAAEIREFLIEKISKNGGHLGANLGAVELTMALHLSLNLPEDKIIWDVGHQSYIHKLLTGRREGFESLRQYGGMSGFPKRKESPCDCFDTGHSTTSISAGLGLVCARDLIGKQQTIVSVIGDGSLTGGMAYEALNNAAQLETNFIIILNDNNMSISENVGGVSNYLNSIRTDSKYLDLKDSIYYRLIDNEKYGAPLARMIQRTKNGIKQLVIPGMLFENMGITYLGPVDGHDIDATYKAIRDAKRVKGAVIVHVCTQKGKGYPPAERHPARFHGAVPFDIQTGLPSKPQSKANWTDVFGTVINKLGERDERVVAITAAMPDGTGLKRFKNRFPERFFDVGIAEEHAVTFAAGLAAGGLRPVVAVYSSFLQRGFDQIIHDVCLQELPVTFAVDRAGLVGADGETHQGIFDISYLSMIPGMTVMSPKNKWELSDMLKFAVGCGQPVAIRYPRGEAYDKMKEHRQPIEIGKAEWIRRDGFMTDADKENKAGKTSEKSKRENDKKQDEDLHIALLAFGSMVETAEQVRTLLEEKGITQVSLLNLRFAKPLDENAVIEAGQGHDLVVTMEENVFEGGIGQRILDLMTEEGSKAKVLPIALPDAYVEHGSAAILKKELGIDAESIFDKIMETAGAL
ncbi:MAG: 1-deoxy-D-xylulose-5-phosphate synthase [Lachnospiraceae bacterium]|nr:1-deoxy-D-xylulose-5-phosphate synthase [Lachnospiraceae bacterium]